MARSSVHKWIKAISIINRLGDFLTNWKHMKNVEKHFQDFFMHFNLKDTSTSFVFQIFPTFQKNAKMF